MKTDLVNSLFSEWLITANPFTLKKFREWVYYPGMLFGSSDTWWGKGRKRPGPHEGLDMGFYRDGEGRIHHWGAMVKIPLMYEGEVKKISNDDFIGQSVYVMHPQFTNQAGEILYSVYAHVTPVESLCEGDRLKAATIIAAVADFSKTKAVMSDHLHLSLAYLPGHFPRGKMHWETMADPGMVTLLNPLDYMGCPYAVRDYSEGEKL